MPCKNGHIGLRYVSNNVCLQCDKSTEKSLQRKEYYERNKESIKKKVSAWASANPEKRGKTTKKWNDKNPGWHTEYGKKWAEKNPEKMREKAKRRLQKDPSYFAHYNALRKARKIQATPKWANLSAIRDIYKACRCISKLSRIQHDVDHIIPLKGKNVCGLHVEYNLRPIPSFQNRKKWCFVIEEPVS